MWQLLLVVILRDVDYLDLDLGFSYKLSNRDVANKLSDVLLKIYYLEKFNNDFLHTMP